MFDLGDCPEALAGRTPVEILLQICARVLSSQTKRKDHNVALEIDQASGFIMVSTMKPFPVTREGSWKRECRRHL
jgi:hypothetical protein